MNVYRRFFRTERTIYFTVLLLLVACTSPAIAPSEQTSVETDTTPASINSDDAENVLTIGIGGDIETLDPGFGQATRANEVLKNIYDQPLRYARTMTEAGYGVADVGTLEGAAWESFEIQPDGVTVKVKVREGVKFVETGNEMTAEDWRYKFERGLVGEVPATKWISNNVNIVDMAQIAVDGSHEFTIKLTDPTPLFAPMMRDQDMGIMDSVAVKEHATDDDPWATRFLAKNYAGAGEYYVESWSPGVEMVLAANPNYWDGPAYFDKVILKIIPSATNRALLLRQGTLDIAEELSLDDINQLQDAPGVKILSIPARDQIIMGLTNSKEPFNDVKVRQALAYAVPYNQILEDVLEGRASVSKSAWPDGSLYYDSGFWPYRYDLEKATALLEEAGFGDGFSFTVSLPSSQPTMEQVAVVLQDSFKQIGVDMRIEKLAPAVFQDKLTKHEFEGWMRDFGGGYIDDPYFTLSLTYETGSTLNWFDYHNDRIDEITEELRTELDPNRREELSKEAQQILNEEVPALYIAEPHYSIAMRDDIEGFLLEPDRLIWYYGLYRR